VTIPARIIISNDNHSFSVSREEIGIKITVETSKDKYLPEALPTAPHDLHMIESYLENKIATIEISLLQCEHFMILSRS